MSLTRASEISIRQLSKRCRALRRRGNQVTAMIRTLLITGLITVFSQLARADIYTASEALERGDYATAVAEFQRLAAAGDARAQAHLGYMYYVGEGVTQSYQQAVQWYRQAALQGDRDAQYNLAVAYAFGEGITQDYAEAAAWYQRAAEQGHVLAQYSMGISYSFGEGVRQDSTEAVKWFQLAADQGYERAQVQLGSKFHTGDGVAQDYAAAASWYRKAADRGNASAQYNLGTLYRSGRGVEQDYNQALRWFRLAADQGYAAAQNELASMERAIAGAARSNTRPSLQPTPVTRPEPVTTQPRTAAVESAAPPAERVAQPVEQPAATIEDRTALFSLDSDDLLTLDDEDPEQAPADAPQQEIMDIDNSGAEPLDETTLLATVEQDSESEENTVPVVDESRPRGFFSRLFGRDSRDTQAEEADDTPDSTVSAGTTVTYQDDSEDWSAASDSDISEPSDDPALADTEEPQTRGGFFSRLFNRSDPEPAVESNPVEDAAITTDEPPVEEEMDDYDIEPETPAAATAAIEPVEEAGQEQQRGGFFSRLFNRNDEESAEDDIDDNTVAMAVEPEDAMDFDEEVDPYAAPEPDPVPASTETVIEENVEESASEDTGQRGGFFSRLFNRNAQEPAVDDIDDNTVAMAVEPEDAMDFDEEVDPYAAPEPDPVPASTEDVIEETVEESASEDTGQRGGFFSRLFNRESNDDNGTSEPEPTAVDTAPARADVNVDPEAVYQSNPEDFQAAQQAFTAREYDQAFLLFRSMALAGDPRAQYRLGNLYHQGLGISRNYRDAMYWYQESAQLGNVDAQYSLGNMYLMGEGIEQNDQQAVYWYEQAARQGHESARHNLQNLRKVVSEAPDAVGEIVPGELPEETDGYEVPPQEDKPGFFSRLFKRDDEEVEVAEAGDGESAPPEETPEAGDELESAVTDSAEEKPGFFSRLFNRDDDDEKRAQYQEEISPELAREASDFIEFEDEETQALAAGDPVVNTYEEGLAYQYGEGVVKNSEMAFQLFMSAATQGYAPAQYKVGAAYAYGEGVTRDAAEAVRWYDLAARQGNAIAQRNLGAMYLNGDGVPVNRALALAWYSVLAENGNVMDARRRDMLAEQITQEERDDAASIREQLVTEILANK